MKIMRFDELSDMRRLMPTRKDGNLLKTHAHFLNITHYYNREIQNLQSQSHKTKQINIKK